ncbi:MAG: magnesium transporter CorA family protein [Candidatus Kerfeldbacteria bacterium]|nr:magnesium transporter CorA family protein [Candidatus Kerfeldbacteria bacterium]
MVAPTDEELTRIGALVGLSKDEIGQMLQRKQRPLVRNLEHYSLIIVHIVESVEHTWRTTPLILFVSKSRHDIISVHKRESIGINRIYAYSAQRLHGIFKQGITHLVSAILDEIMDTYFLSIDELSDRIERIEEEMFDYTRSKEVMQRTFITKKSMIYIHKALVANRDVIAGIEKEYATFLDQNQLAGFRELNSDIVQMIEMVTTYRDILTSAIEIHLTTISNSLNVTMKRVTSWGAIILVPSLIAGIFGMNFQDIPMLNSHFGFWLAIGSMVVSVYVLALYFKRKDWF